MYYRIQNCVRSHHITPHHTTPHHTTLHHTTPHHTTPYHITPHHITSHHIIPYHTTPHHTIPYHKTHHFTSHHITPLHNTPHHTGVRTYAYGQEGTSGSVTANSPTNADVTNTSIVAPMSDISRIRPEGTVSTVNCKEKDEVLF